ncbi:DNA-binding response regulator [Dokdonia pacifica]|uniref:Two component transcriptional regulator, LytTR family n=1 Tax=Dokdonia pacifica TaxID=1627892 RepID=A0A238YI03_9FLAO|nr:LytTR family DNA-binding domain-containing protein [Dokdonia pacifica]GGG12185.1 DNA-binding response regulator [Dokdonia pacifica]SNR70757.1 two component transcriptional regulator, LytTR family [Dokdonia pacifica]
MITYLIIDDEHIAHGIIKRYCDMMPNMQLMKNCYDALEAIEYLNTHTVDLIFLDLNMPKLKGFDFLKTLASPPKVIVTTAYQEFALEGYELNIVDYLLKPFSFERFLKAVNKATVNTTPNPTIINTQTTETHSSKIFLRSNKKYTQVAVDTILFLESAGNYVKVVTKDSTITVRDKITDVLEKLPQKDFIQVHKSFAVAKNHIDSIEGNRIIIQGTTVPIGQTYKSNIHTLLQ